MKPDITFFGEALPDNFFDRLKDVDREKVDLVIVMGTSMKVAPVSEIPNFVPRDVPQIYISRDVSCLVQRRESPLTRRSPSTTSTLTSTSSATATSSWPSSPAAPAGLSSTK
jgi:NAD-dependent SIR2 family protein deacetylase